MIYLAIPYTWNPDLSFQIANKVAAELMSNSEVVFSPISHSHSIADHLNPELRTDQEFWMHQDLPFVKKCDKMVIVCIDGDHEMIRRSKGVQREIKEAEMNQIPITFYDYNTPL